MPPIDLQGAYLDELHHPTLLAQSNIDQQHVFPLLFDTGLRGTSCMFDREHQNQHTQFTGVSPLAPHPTINVRLASVSGVQSVEIGMPLALPNPAPAFARAASLVVMSRGHACAISHQYLLAAQPRLVAFWSTAPAVPHTPIDVPPDEYAALQGIFRQPALEVYAVPISLVDSTNAVAVATVPPQVPNEVALNVDIRPSGLYTNAQVSRLGGQPIDLTSLNVDTGASYTVIHASVADALGLFPNNVRLREKDDAEVIIPRLDFPNAALPVLSLLNMPAVVTIGNGEDQLVLGSSLFDRFTTVVFDLGNPGPQNGVIRLLP